MKTKFIISSLVITIISCAQNGNLNCNKILDKVPYFVTHNINEDSDSVKIDMEILKSCGKLDSIDAELLTGPVLGTTILNLNAEHKKITYQTILDNIYAFKKTENYSRFRETIIVSKTLEKKPVTLSEFEKDKVLLQKVGMTETELEDFKLFLEVNSKETMTYKEAFAKYINSKPSYQSPEEKIIAFNELISLEDALKAGRESNKKILIYFSGFANVNARKMEENVLTDERVKMLLTQKLYYCAAYTDDKRTDENNSTIGKKNIKLQAEKFKSQYQPYFYILDEKGNILSEIGYTNKPEEFIDFLNKGLK